MARSVHTMGTMGTMTTAPQAQSLPNDREYLNRIALNRMLSQAVGSELDMERLVLDNLNRLSNDQLEKVERAFT